MGRLSRLIARRGPTPNFFEQQPTWFFDFGNTTGKANNGNDGLTAASPLLTWTEVLNRWTTYAPRLRQDTTLTFMSSQPDTTDPVYFLPYIEGSLVQVVGQLTQVGAGNLAGVVPVNRATPQLLNATLGGAFAAGQLVVNTTQPSRAWTYVNVAGTTWSLNYPLQSQTVGALTPPQVNWANTDAFTVNTLPHVHIARIGGQVTYLNAGFNNLLQVRNISFASGSTGDDSAIIEAGALLVECAVPTGAIQWNRQNYNFLSSGMVNCYVASLGITGAALGVSPLTITGGIYSGSNFQLHQESNLTGDVILNCFVFCQPGELTHYGRIYIETGKLLTYLGGGIASPAASFQYGSPIFWGPGSLRFGGNMRAQYPTGAGAAVATFQHKGSFDLNGTTTVWSVTGGAGPTAGKTLSAANLDTDGGAATVCYQNPGGASITNTGNAS